jgi:hypothetical protein
MIRYGLVEDPEDRQGTNLSDSLEATIKTRDALAQVGKHPYVVRYEIDDETGKVVDRHLYEAIP